ncbi:MAG TPA: cupin domain-containing protein [Burkholderiales bacterium]|nr:cupin domain-containing protein [Burkholderiales bacterium]
MAEGIKPIRRVVTGHDAQGRSCVLYDGPAPNVNANAFKKGTAMTDIWVFHECPAPIRGERDDGNLPFRFEPPPTGGHLRIVQSDPKPPDYDPARDAYLVAPHPPRRTPGGTWERGGQNLYTTRMHKSETLDYGILLSGSRVLVTDDGSRTLAPGDVVVQLGSWHAWANPDEGSLMAFVMMGAEFGDG